MNKKAYGIASQNEPTQQQKSTHFYSQLISRFAFIFAFVLRCSRSIYYASYATRIFIEYSFSRSAFCVVVYGTKTCLFRYSRLPILDAEASYSATNFSRQFLSIGFVVASPHFVHNHKRSQFTIEKYSTNRSGSWKRHSSGGSEKIYKKKHECKIDKKPHEQTKSQEIEQHSAWEQKLSAVVMRSKMCSGWHKCKNPFDTAINGCWRLIIDRISFAFKTKRSATENSTFTSAMHINRVCHYYCWNLVRLKYKLQNWSELLVWGPAWLMLNNTFYSVG